MNLLQVARTELLRSNTDREHPFRLMTLATQALYPEVRTVVKRHISEEMTIRFYTDARSPKVGQMRQQPWVSCLFYHPRQQLQVRVKGQAQLVQEGPIYATCLEQITQSTGLRDYTTEQAPGSSLLEATRLDPGGSIHFLVVEVVSAEIEVLQLNREQHQRSVFFWQENEWTERRLVP